MNKLKRKHRSVASEQSRGVLRGETVHTFDLAKGMSLLGICLDSDKSSLMNFFTLMST
jgi:hypothetical protein